MKKGLFALALGTFTLGIAEFIIEGILTDVAHNMNVSIPQAGHLISIYALGVCVGAFSLILMHKYRPKNILLFLTSLVILGAIIATIAPSYGLLLCARFIQGLPHGAYFGTATIVAVKMAKEGKGTKAVAMMCAGMPFANLLGVPLGTFLSHTISWRVPFLMSVALGVITLYMIYKWVPDVEALPNKGMKAQFRFMRHLAPWLIIAATFLGNGGILCWFSYISPLLQIDGGFHAASISVLMILAGLGMVVGNQVSALLADRFKPGRFTCYLQFLAAAALLLLSVAYRLGIGSDDVYQLCLSFRYRFARAVSHCEAQRGWRDAGWLLHSGSLQSGQCPWSLLGRNPRGDGIGI